jgi:hypothetical protein
LPILSAAVAPGGRVRHTDYFINGRKMGGRLTPDGFRVAIDAVLEKAGKTVRNY